jgi:hypothetical protein
MNLLPSLLAFGQFLADGIISSAPGRVADASQLNFKQSASGCHGVLAGGVGDIAARPIDTLVTSDAELGNRVAAHPSQSEQSRNVPW